MAEDKPKKIKVSEHERNAPVKHVGPEKPNDTQPSQTPEQSTQTANNTTHVADVDDIERKPQVASEERITSDDTELRVNAKREAFTAAQIAHHRKMGKEIQPGPKFTLEQVEHALKNAMGNVSLASTILKCERGTIHDYINRHPHLDAIRQASRKDFADIAEGHLMIATRTGKEWAVRDTLRAFGKLIGFDPEGAISKANMAIQNNVTVNFVHSEDASPRVVNGNGKDHD